ncbi:MAG TPA: (Fe-S)-binding protein [Ktedonobacterales bacterium]|jgi:glycolate oxidase iron-sulfur subunit|nr:(Fe-S)-binding protein [Ktedonobacterales bacterium]
MGESAAEAQATRAEKARSQVSAEIPIKAQTGGHLVDGQPAAPPEAIDLTQHVLGAGGRGVSGFTGPDQPSDDILQKCIRCGFCLPTCPTYLETYSEASSPRGRIRLIQAVADGELSLTDSGFVEQMYQCLDCRACEAVCPSGVRYGQLVEAARTQIERARPRPVGQRALRSAIFGGLFADRRRFRLAGRALRLYQRSGARRLARQSGALDVLGLRATEALAPDAPDQFYTPHDEVYAAPPDGPQRGRVALFAGCVMSSIFAGTDRATIRVLNANGFTVVAPAAQECCGALTIHAGEMDRARTLAARNIEAFEASGTAYIISNAAGCGSALKEYGQLFADFPAWRERAEAFAARVRDITELLGDALARGELSTRFEPLPMTVTYQEPCHLAHAQRITRQPRALLAAIPGLRVVEMVESSLCCGSAGVYNITRPEMAGALGRRKAGHIVATRAQAVVTANPGCALQLRSQLQQMGSDMPVLHIVDLLDAAYRGRMPL